MTWFFEGKDKQSGDMNRGLPVAKLNSGIKYPLSWVTERATDRQSTIIDFLKMISIGQTIVEKELFVRTAKARRTVGLASGRNAGRSQ